MERIVSRIGHVTSKACQKLKLYKECYDLLGLLLDKDVVSSKRGDWWNRRALIAERYFKDAVLSYEICNDAFKEQDTLSVSDLEELGTRINRLGKKLYNKLQFKECKKSNIKQVTIVGKPIESIVGRKSLFWSMDNDRVSVEELALEYYQSEEGGLWEQGLHCEGGIFRMIFSLLFWNILWDDSVQYAFLSPVQAAPLDLFSSMKCFYNNRKESIDSRLEWIKSSSPEYLSVEITQCWEHNRGTECIGLPWEYTDIQALQAIIKGLDPIVVSCFCSIMVKHYTHASSGLPDLCIWRTCPCI